mmetsp:Transcript_3580/g.5446  ORF Transcript_3580/g.5446 Transcript_3580/m.5446 type:complete len:241 (+) Transcript_3580:13-735(+)
MQHFCEKLTSIPIPLQYPSSKAIEGGGVLVPNVIKGHECYSLSVPIPLVLIQMESIVLFKVIVVPLIHLMQEIKGRPKYLFWLQHHCFPRKLHRESRGNDTRVIVPLFVIEGPIRIQPSLQKRRVGPCHKKCRTYDSLRGAPLLHHIFPLLGKDHLLWHTQQQAFHIPHGPHVQVHVNSTVTLQYFQTHQIGPMRGMSDRDAKHFGNKRRWHRCYVCLCYGPPDARRGFVCMVKADTVES